MTNKKVIFIGGSSYSGSTLLDMILANAPQGFSCGEVHALFHPYRRRHIRFECGCGDPGCGVWPAVLKHGAQHLYETIFLSFPEVEFIVDSSKDPMWIHDRTRDLVAAGVEVKNILIWKTPEEFFDSREKRGRATGWKRAWINYHKLYFRLVKDWQAISYKDLVSSADMLDQLCQRLEIPYFQGKSDYWNKKHHTMLGNTSAKIHLYNAKSDRFEKCKEELSSHDASAENTAESEKYRAIYYAPSERPAHKHLVDVEMQQIMQILTSKSIADNPQAADTSASIEELRASLALHVGHRIKRTAKSLLIRAAMKAYPF